MLYVAVCRHTVQATTIHRYCIVYTSTGRVQYIVNNFIISFNNENSENHAEYKIHNFWRKRQLIKKNIQILEAKQAINLYYVLTLFLAFGLLPANKRIRAL